MSNETAGRTSIELTFAMCEVCGKKDGRPGHECDGGDALRKAARELFGPTLDLIEPMLVKAGTGILRGVFEILFERDALKIRNAELLKALDSVDADIDQTEDENCAGRLSSQTAHDVRVVLGRVSP